MDEFEWDENKANANIAKHGIDFQGAIRIFESFFLLIPSDRRHEERLKAIGAVDDVVITVVFTWRETRRRIISARRAKHDERQAYRQAHAGGPEEG